MLLWSCFISYAAGHGDLKADQTRSPVQATTHSPPAAVAAVSQRNLAVEQGQVATTRAIDASANARAVQRLDVAQRHAAEAQTRRSSAPDTRAALLQVVAASPHLARFAENAVAVSVIVGGNEAVVTGAADGSVRVWDLDAPASLLPLARLGRPVVAVAIIADGRNVTAGGGHCGRLGPWLGDAAQRLAAIGVRGGGPVAQ